MASTTKMEQKAAGTRRALIDAGRTLFGERGYAGASVEEVVRLAGVTKGALYHHFRDKDDLFCAVVEDVKGEVTTVVGTSFLAGTEDPDVFESVVRGCLALIDAHLDPAVRRITVLDAQAVLDPAARRELANRYEVAVIRGALRRAVHRGALAPQPIPALAHVLAGALMEACALVAEADDRAAVLAEIEGVVRRLLGGLRPQP